MNTVSLLQQLIQIPSVSVNEEQIQKWIFDYLLGLKLKPQWVGPNVVCKIAGKDNSKALIFNAHVDTVSSGDEKLWIYGPFSGKVVGNKIYGLGSSDMKSGVAVMLKLIESYSKTQSPVDLWFHFVVKEETDGSGTGEVMDWFVKEHKNKYTNLSGIIAEPTGGKEIKIAHKGNIFLKITTKGDGSHGSTPEKVKKHAVKMLFDIGIQLEAMVKEWAKNYSDPLLGSPSIAIFTSFQAGDIDSPNKIEDTASATFDIRTTPSIHHQAFQMIKQKFESTVVKIDTVYDPLSYGYTPKDSYIVQLAKKITKGQLGIDVGSDDLLFFTAVNIPAIIFGPGTVGVEHEVNEYTEIKNLDKCHTVYEKIIQEF